MPVDKAAAATAVVTPTSPAAIVPVFDPQSLGKPAKRRTHKRSATGYIPERDEKTGQEIWPRGDEDTWKKGLLSAPPEDEASISDAIVHHIQTTIARQAYNLDDVGAYQAVALAVRDDLIINWNDTQSHFTRTAPKRAYYLSLEFLRRTLDNALLNLGLRDKFSNSIDKLGFNLEDILDTERDAGLGNGGLGRLAACYLDSSASMELPVWGYGLRYKYGIFQQLIAPDGSQLEAPDPWLNNGNPWEIHRPDVKIDVRFYGHSQRIDRGRAVWTAGQEVNAIAYDVPIPGYGGRNTNNLRLWDAKPKSGFDLLSFNAGDYHRAVDSSNQAESITRVLYPNDNHDAGKELRLKQQYFWTAASLGDIVRRFKDLGKPITEFPQYVSIQLNDTHPTLAIPELTRILVDEEEVEWNTAWKIVTRTFAYTNHTVLPEALEKWPIPLVENLLPRHMQIIYDINSSFLKAVEAKYPGDRDRLARMSLIDETFPKFLRMANLAVIGSFKVNGVAELHSQLVQTTILKDFAEFYPGKFGNITNGITPRRWLDQCNPGLSALITETLGGKKDAWLKDLNLLKGLTKYADDPAFQKKWDAIKLQNKERLAHYIEKTTGVIVNTKSMFDIQVKRIHEYKRQNMNILAVIHRYLTIKALTPEKRKKVVPRTVLFAGKAAPGYYAAKLTIRLIVNVAHVINADPDVKGILTVLFLPDYAVSVAELLIPASDISQHISTAGTEASGTSNMKFCLNGGLLLGTVDGASIEIAEEVGEENVFMFGHLAPAVEDLRYQHQYRHVEIQQRSPTLSVVLDEISNGRFGDSHVYESILNNIRGGDYYLISEDFDSYLQAQEIVDEAYQDRTSWIKKSIRTVALMGKFSSDRAILQYAEEIWNIEPTPLKN